MTAAAEDNAQLVTFVEVTASEEAEAFAAGLIKEGKTVPAGEWSRPTGERIDEYVEANGWESLGKWFLGRNQDAEPETHAFYEFPFSNDFEKVHRRGLIAARERAAEYQHEEVFDAAGRLLDLYDKDQAGEVSADDALAICFFAGSPMSKYGTHGSKGFKGDYAAAWRIHFSQVGGGSITPKAAGPIRGTVRRVAMIAAAMKPACEVKPSEGMKARGGGKSPLPGSFPSSPSDYGLKKWAKPSDDDLTQEDIRLTCKDLNVIKAAAIQEIYWRAAQREKTASSPAVKRISFQRCALRKRGRYKVNQKSGEMSDVSLIQMGEAKGHGMWIDGQSLETALDVLLDSTLPAYVTHAGALDSDRLLNEVGVFSGFYLADGKLKAESFKVLASFRADEPERYRRLFDLAEAMPDAFGLSMVFEAALVWVKDDGTEVPIEDGSPEESLRDLPSVRFLSIRSADFVDTPAANDSGLFSKPTKTSQGVTQMDEENEVKEEGTEEAEATEEVEAAADPEETNPEQELAKKIEELQAQVEEQAGEISKLKEALGDSEAQAEKLSALIEGEEALEAAGDSTPTPTILEQFEAAQGAAKTRFWKLNKTGILDAARGAK